MRRIFLSNSTIVLGSFLLLSMTVIKTNLQDLWDVPDEYQNVKNPYSQTEDDERIGRIVYSKYCKFCHGKKGDGNGNQAKLLQTAVADFTTDAFKSQTDGSMFYKIQTGRNDMPSFDKIITDEEDLWMLINYIKSF